jgi:hypothetical protein
MQNKKNKIVMLLAFLCVSSINFAMVWDNRFLPLIPSPALWIEESVFEVAPFFVTASRAASKEEEGIGIPEIFGNFDQGTLSDAFDIAGIPNALRSDWRGFKIPWVVNSKIQGQGAQFYYHQALGKHFSLGFSWFFLRLSSSLDFALKADVQNEPEKIIFGPSDRQELDNELRTMLRTIGIVNSHSDQAGFSDVDAYFRVGNVWRYTLKCRKIEAGARLGALIASGVKRILDEPASIPFGGNGHWGMYGELDTLFEVKEDIKVGCIVRISKRFARTQCERMPVAGEPLLFGATTGFLRVNPGITANIAPYFDLENLRDGLGLSVQYTLTAHQKDELEDVRSDKKAIPVRLGRPEDDSSWISSYFTINVFYDFGRMQVKREFDPIVFLRWDVPSMVFGPKRSLLTHKIAVGVSFYF